MSRETFDGDGGGDEDSYPSKYNQKQIVYVNSHVGVEIEKLNFWLATLCCKLVKDNLKEIIQAIDYGKLTNGFNETDLNYPNSAFWLVQLCDLLKARNLQSLISEVDSGTLAEWLISER